MGGEDEGERLCVAWKGRRRIYGRIDWNGEVEENKQLAALIYVISDRIFPRNTKAHWCLPHSLTALKVSICELISLSRKSHQIKSFVS